MTEQHDFERLVARELASVDVPDPLAAGFEDIVRDRAAKTRRRPRWLARVSEPPLRVGSTVAAGSPTGRVAAIMAATLLLAVLVAGAAFAGSRLLATSSTIIIVDQTGAGTVASLTEAVAMAVDGDEIRVRPGTYVESVDVSAGVTISGEGPVEAIVLQAPPDGPFSPAGRVPMVRYAILIRDGTTTVSGLTLRGLEAAVVVAGGTASLIGLRFEGVGEPPAAGADSRGFLNAIVVGGDAIATVTGSRLVESGSILIGRGAVARVEDNDLVDGASISALVTIDGSEIVGNRIVSPTSVGIEVQGGGRVRIEDNLIRDPVGEGILLGDSGAVDTTPDIRRNTIERASVGIDIPPLSAPNVIGNVLLDNDVGIRSGWDSTALVRDNELRANRVGIELDAADGRYEGNVIRGGAIGIQIERDADPALIGNDVDATETAALALGSARLTDVRDNRFCSLETGRSVVTAGGVTSADALMATNRPCDDAMD